MENRIESIGSFKGVPMLQMLYDVITNTFIHSEDILPQLVAYLTYLDSHAHFNRRFTVF